MFKFEVTTTEGKSRVGKLTTPHGVANTPIYFPVGTQATVKALDSRDLEELGTEMILANTYHLYLHPGPETMEKLGGLHKYMNWGRPILTDSGGYQVFSLGFGIEHDIGKVMNMFDERWYLGQVLETDDKRVVTRTKLCKIEEEGPTFQSHIDGSAHFFPPEKSIDVQTKLGADLIVALDECTSPLHDYNYTKTSMGRTHRWAIRSLEHLKKLKSESPNIEQEMFGVVQGGPFEDLRIESAKFISNSDFFGVGIGGPMVSRAKMPEILRWMHPYLDPEKPRHLLGIGTVIEIFNGVEEGMDIFDCIYPTKIARSGYLLYKLGEDDATIGPIYNHNNYYFDIGKAIFSDDPRPIDSSCMCYTCRNYSRAYIHHLFRVHELLSYRLATIHNVHFMLHLMEDIRTAIAEKRFAKMKQEWLQY